MKTIRSFVAYAFLAGAVCATLAQENEDPIPPREQVPARGESKPVPFLGVFSTPAPSAMAAQLGLDEGFGVLIMEVVPDSPAAKAGMQKSDVIKLVDDQRVLDSNHLSQLIRSHKAGDDVMITFVREAEEQQVTVKISERLMEPGNFVEVDQHVPVVISKSYLDQFVPLDLAPTFRDLRSQQEQLLDYRVKFEKFQKELQKWARDPQGEMPKMPPAFEPLQLVPLPPAHHSVMPEVASHHASSSVTANRSESRATMKDDDGEVLVLVKDGKKTLQAKDKSGKIVFDGPIDTPEQIAEVPAPFQVKLKAIEIHR